MQTFERESLVDAPLARVWTLHSTVDGLRALTPGWLDLSVEAVRAGDGERLDTGATLEAGTVLRLSWRPLGVGPRRTWVSQITAREERDDRAYFRDEMRQGPFRRWIHTHCFAALDGATLLRDRVAYETALGEVVDVLAGLGMTAAFAYRHRRTRSLLE